MSAFRIGLDFHVVDGKFQGSRTHVIEMFSAVIKNSPDFDFVIFLDKPEILEEISPVFSLPNVLLVRMPKSNAIVRLFWQLPWLSRKYKIDLLHTQYVLPWPVTCMTAVTIHDVLFEIYPQYFTTFFVLRSRFFMRRAARNADLLFTVSNFSKLEISRLYGVSADSIYVVHNGVDSAKFSPRIETLDVLSGRGLSDKGYILSVGRLEPRKNHAVLIEAYARLESPPPLVIVGQRDFKFDGVFKMISKYNLKDRVHILEDVSDDELPVLYRHAAVFAYPAFAEGFGMPPLEAMAAGTPVITSNTTSLPEVVGSAGIVISPESVEELAGALRRVLTNQEETQILREAGLARSFQFDWIKPASILRSRYLKLSKGGIRE